MLGTVDAIKRPLKIPPRFIPYMEKHRIYELFHEIATQLVIKKPPDHILYIKQCLQHAARSRDAPRIIILSPPDFDRKLLAEYLDINLGIKAISLEDLESFDTIDDFKRSIRKILRKLYFEESGWIFIDFPRTKSEARALQSIGILPTHVIELVWTDPPSESGSSQFLDDDNSVAKSSHDKIKRDKSINLHNQQGLREVYTNNLIQVETAGRTYEEIGRACITLAKRRKHSLPCYNFRVVLIGPRGSGRRSISKYLAQAYNLVCIDFVYLIAQMRLQKNAIGESLRCLDRWGIDVKSDIRIKVIEKKLMSYECLKRGWVLFGYPITVEDFQLLDRLPTPPNRIIFIDVDGETCRNRLFSRRFNVVTGSQHDIRLDDLRNCDTNLKMGIHENDLEDRVNLDLEEYFTNLDSLLNYAGDSAMIVDGRINERNMREKVESCLDQAPSAPPRIRKFKTEIRPEEVEYDPDDPPDPKIYEGIRKHESILSLI